MRGPFDDSEVDVYELERQAMLTEHGDDDTVPCSWCGRPVADEYPNVHLHSGLVDCGLDGNA